MNGAKSLVHTLLAAGVDTCFANPGTSEMHFVAALDQVPGMRCVLGLQENVVTGMADGYFRIARKPAHQRAQAMHGEDGSHGVASALGDGLLALPYFRILPQPLQLREPQRCFGLGKQFIEDQVALRAVLLDQRRGQWCRRGVFRVDDRIQALDHCCLLAALA